MLCPGCHSFDLDATARCGGCGLQLSIYQELRLRALMPAPKTRPMEEQRFDYAQREGY